MDLYKEYLEKTGIYGTIQEIKYPLIYIDGLPEVRPNEMIIFETGEKGLILDIEEYQVHALLLSNNPVPLHTMVARTGEQISITVSDELLGKAIDPLGQVITGEQTPVISDNQRPIFIAAPGIDKRSKITEPFITGISKVDLLIPLGKGQRELILGDVKTGKTSLVLNILKSQILMGDTIVIYASIGKKQSEIKELILRLQRENLMTKSIIVATAASDSPSLVYLTPYVAMTLAEYFKDQGHNVVLILDDLSIHAENYREISLLSRRFPGRESYPGDIFYAHASLLERAGNYIFDGKKNVSITCLPLATTVEGDITGYISTNLMGMTDGHILFDVEIYNKGHRPAINIPLSVTRVGRQAQSNLHRSINVEILSILSQYDKLQDIAHLGSELSGESKRILEKGKALHVILHQEKMIIPHDIQTILFGIVWLGLCDMTTPHIYQSVLTNLMKLYADDNGKKIIIDLTEAPSLSKFLLQLKTNQQIGALCMTKTTL